MDCTKILLVKIGIVLGAWIICVKGKRYGPCCCKYFWWDTSDEMTSNERALQRRTARPPHSFEQAVEARPCWRAHIGEKVGFAKLTEKANEETNFKHAASQEPENPEPSEQPYTSLLSLNHVLPSLTRKRSFDMAFLSARPLEVNRPKEERDLSFAKCLCSASVKVSQD